MKARILIGLMLAVLILCITGIKAVENSAVVPDGTIYGQVYEAETKQPLSQAFVYCHDVNSSKKTSDSQGYYAFESNFLPSNAYTIRCSRYGYYSSETIITTDSKGNARVNFFLKQKKSPASASLNINACIAALELRIHDDLIKNCDRALETNPNDPIAWTYKGAAFQEMGRTSDALECYNKSIDLAPDLDAAWMYKGLILYWEKYRLNEESVIANQTEFLIKSKPTDSFGWSCKGLAMYDAGKYEGALKCFDEAVILGPEVYETWYYRGLTLKALDRDSEADVAFTKARELGYND